MSLTPSNQFEDLVEACIADLDGQDEMYFHDVAMRTIVWYIGKAKSFVHYSAEIRTTERTQFLEAVAARKKIKPRRLLEALAVYRREAKPSDSVLELSERIFQKYGNWTKALPPKPTKEAIEPQCKNCFHCPHS